VGGGVGKGKDARDDASRPFALLLLPLLLLLLSLAVASAATISEGTAVGTTAMGSNSCRIRAVLVPRGVKGSG